MSKNAKNNVAVNNTEITFVTKEVFTGPKDKKVFLGTLVMESCQGRIAELAAANPTLIASLVDTQLLHHPATTAFKQGEDKDKRSGLDRLPDSPRAGQQLWRDSEGRVRVNWDFVPQKRLSDSEKFELLVQEKVAEKIETLREWTDQEITPEVIAQITEKVRKDLASK